MNTVNELAYIETIPNKYDPHYAYSTKFVFKDIKTFKKYELYIEKNRLEITYNEKTYRICCNFINQSILRQQFEMIINSKCSTAHFNIGSMENIENNVGCIEYRFGYNVVASGYKERHINKINYDLTIDNPFILLKLHILATPVFTADNETLLPIESKIFDETFIFQIPFKIVSSILNLNDSTNYLLYKNYKEEKIEEKIVQKQSLLKKVKNIFSSSNKPNHINIKDLDSYKKINTMEFLLNDSGKKVFYFTNKKNEYLYIEFIIERLYVSKMSEDYKTIPYNPTTIGYRVVTKYLNSSQIKSILFKGKELTKLPMKLEFEGNNLGGLFSKKMPDLIIKKINCEISINEIELCFNINTVASINTEQEEVSTQLNEKYTDNFQFEIPLDYVPEILNMNQKEKDIFNAEINIKN